MDKNPTWDSIESVPSLSYDTSALKALIRPDTPVRSEASDRDRDCPRSRIDIVSIGCREIGTLVAIAANGDEIDIASSYDVESLRQRRQQLRYVGRAHVKEIEQAHWP